MNKYVGLLDKIRVIKTQPLLVRFTLQTIHESINCVVADIEIIDKLLIMDDGKYNIAVTGHFNKRNQLVIACMKLEIPIILRDRWAYKRRVVVLNEDCSSFCFT